MGAPTRVEPPRAPASPRVVAGSKRRFGNRGTRRHDLSVLGLPVLAVAVTFPFATGISGPLLLGIVAAFALGVIGVLTVGGTLPRWTIAVTAYVAAAATSLGGLRLDASGSTLSNSVLTAALLGTVALSARRAEMIGGGGILSGAVLATGGALVARAHGDGSTTVVAAAVAIACAAVITIAAATGSRARLGVGGSLFTGFVVAALAVEGGTDYAFPRTLLLPMLLIAVPVLDGVCVAVTRARRGSLPPDQLGLVGRLRARRIGVAVPVVVGTQVVLALVAVLCAERELTTRAAALIAVVVVGVVMFTLTVLPVSGPPGRLSSRGRVVLAIALVVIGALGGVAGLAATRIAPWADSARAASERALDAARRGKVRDARREFKAAQHDFEQIRDSLSGLVSSLSLGLPVVGQNVRAAREVAVIGADLSRTGARLSSSANPHRIAVSGGKIRLDELRRLEVRLNEARRELKAARSQLSAIDARTLVAPLAGVVDVLERRLDGALTDTADVSKAMRVLPAILGGDGARHYLLIVQNNAEVRGTGGFMGNFGEITTLDGHMELSRFGRINDLNDAAGCFTCIDKFLPADYRARYARFQPTWGDLNVSPDFPEVASILADLYPKSGGQPVDGVIAIDPVGLSSILKITGPVTVPTWPDPITAANVVQVTLLDAYRLIPDRDARADFLGDVARATWNALSVRPLGRADELVKALTDAVVGKHAMVWFSRAPEQQLAVDADMAGAVPAKADDQVVVTTNNVSSNKVDQFVSRSMQYTARLTPTDDGAQFKVKSSLEVGFKNGAPTSGLPLEVIGPAPDSGLEAGESVVYLSALSPLSLDAGTVDGAPAAVQTFTELGRNAYSLGVFDKAGSSSTVALSFNGTVRQHRGGWYDLDISRQAQLVPDQLTVTVEVPPGYRFIESRGLKIALGGRRASVSMQLLEDEHLRVRVARDPAHS